MNLYDIAIARKLSGGSGGGGGGDVSLANVTLNATAPQGYTVDWWGIGGAYTPPFGEEDVSRYQQQENHSETTNTFPVILYQGVAYINTLDFFDTVHEVGFNLEEPILSDNVTFDSDYGRYVVTGDCTIGGNLTIFE